MAPTERSIVICSPLCFVLTKFHKVSCVKIVAVLCDCFSSEDISTAKKRLVLDIQSLAANISSSNLRVRRDADQHGRQHKEATDIVTIISELDQQGLLACLPIYVIDDTDSVPTLKLESGELSYFMQRFEKMESAILSVQETVNKLFNIVSSPAGLSSINRTLSLIEKSIATVNLGQAAIATGPRPSFFAGGQSDNTVHHVDISDHIVRTCMGETRATTIRPTSVISNVSVNNTAGTTLNTNSGGGPVVDSQGRWADYPPTSASSAVDTDDAIDSLGDNFTLVESRRTKRRRIRRRSPPSNINSPSTATASAAVGPDAVTGLTFSTAVTNTPSKKPTRKPLVVGTMRSPPSLPGGAHQLSGSTVQSTRKLVAAKPLYGKAVFCVDNVSNDVTAADLSQFVKSLGVRVLDCNDTKPRRSFRQKQNNIIPDDHRAFFLCINKADTDLLLNASKWPADVSISAWFFKKKDAQQSSTTAMNQTVVQSNTTTTATTVAADVITVAADVTVSAATAVSESESYSVDSRPVVVMNLSPINNNDNNTDLELHNTGQSDEFDEASDILNVDNAAHNSTTVHVVDLSSITE